jgi:hypothetical protein
MQVYISADVHFWHCLAVDLILQRRIPFPRVGLMHGRRQLKHSLGERSNRFPVAWRAIH